MAGRGRGSDPSALSPLAADVLGAGGRADVPAPQDPEAPLLAVPSLHLTGQAPCPRCTWRVPPRRLGCRGASQGSRSKV